MSIELTKASFELKKASIEIKKKASIELMFFVVVGGGDDVGVSLFPIYV